MARKKSYQRGSVKEHGGVWTLRYREFNHATGKWDLKRVRLGCFRNIKDVKRAAADIMSEVNRRNNGPAPLVRPDLTFEEFVNQTWKAYTVTARYQPSTMDHHDSLIKTHLLPRFGSQKLRDIRPADISRFLEGLRPAVATNTLHSFYSLLRLMFDIACQYDLIDRSPVRPKLHRPEPAKVEKPTLDAAQVRAIIGEMRESERLVTLLIAVTGLRLGEVLALRWTDFNATASELAIRHTLYRLKLKSPKTPNSSRSLRLAPAIAELLVAHRERSPFQAEEDFIFCRKDGEPFNATTLRKHLQAAMDRTGIQRVKGQHGFHIFRHTAGSLLYARSRDLKLVQTTLGHSNISTTSDIYVHLDDLHRKEGTDILAGEILPNGVKTVPKRRREAG